MTYIHPLQQFSQRVAEMPDKVWLNQPYDRHWKALTWKEADHIARTIAAGLIDQGFMQGDKIAILAKNSAEWLLADIAIAMAGMVSVPIYATAGEDTIQYVLEHSESRAVFVGKLDNDTAFKRVNTSLTTIGFPYPDISALHQWESWLETYQPLQEIATPSLEDIYTIVYTSGSTGKPKGVLLSASNLAAGANAMSAAYDGSKTNRMISYLPLAHITERSLVFMAALYQDVELFFNESLETFLDDLKYAKPTAFLTVPRLWAKFQAQILTKIPDKKLQLILALPIVGKIFAKKIRAQLGFSSCILFGSGTAPISPSLLHWWGRLGIDIQEGWGMTEVSGMGAGNTPFSKARLGTIGEPLSAIAFKLAENGELLVKGDAVFKSYYKNTEATQASFEDGWFKTGDKACQSANGAWSITGRVKEQFKTAKGKYVAPVPLEALVDSNTYIEQSCVLGSGMSQPLALVVISHGQNTTKETVKASLMETLNTVNSSVESHERLDHIIVVKSAWTIDNGLLTPTLKLKRDAIEKHYLPFIDQTLTDKIIWQ